jgi:hypothetical protein
MKDMKEGLTSSRKADTTHVRKSIKVYIARACEWGSVKYERGNFLRPVGDRTNIVEATRADFLRHRGYLRAAQDHIADGLDSMERHLALDPRLEDVEGMRRAAYAEDTDAKPGCPHGHSGLPHVAPAAASLMMAIEQATYYGLLPADPGQPWAERKASHLSMVQEAMRRAHPEEKIAELAELAELAKAEADGWITGYPKVGEGF